jgi:hypothetical protein
MSKNCGIQKILKNIGDYGCYFLSIIRHSERDVVDIYTEALEKGWITEDCYVLNPVELHNAFGMSKVSKVVHGLEPGYKRLFGVFCFKGNSHFVELGKDKEVIYDSLNLDLRGWSLVSFRSFI